MCALNIDLGFTSDVSVQSKKTTNTSTALVTSVGITLHAQHGYKVRFSNKGASERISHLLGTKVHSNMVYCTLKNKLTSLETCILMLPIIKAEQEKGDKRILDEHIMCLEEHIMSHDKTIFEQALETCKTQQDNKVTLTYDYEIR